MKKQIADANIGDKTITHQRRSYVDDAEGTPESKNFMLNDVSELLTGRERPFRMSTGS